MWKFLDTLDRLTLLDAFKDYSPGLYDEVVSQITDDTERIVI